MNTEPRGIVFPHQLYEDTPLKHTCSAVYLVEEFLFFRQYNFHKQKIAYHRASMKFYEAFLQKNNIEVIYIDAQNKLSDIRELIAYLSSSGIRNIEYTDTTDDWLEKRIAVACRRNNITAKQHPSRMFLNTKAELDIYFKGRKRFFQTDFYKHQRISRDILIEKDQKPAGGKWSFDADNRSKYPKTKIPPVIEFPELNGFYEEAFIYTQKYFSDNYGELNTSFLFPCTFKESNKWLTDFLKIRFAEFGLYEDAIVAGENVLHHSLLTPMLNTGLISPQKVVTAALSFAEKKDIPMNSLEGFIRQITGWREFIRAVYQLKGNEERTRNFWKFSRKIPASFWTGTTGIEPVDITIKKVLKTGYCHHIERLMVLGNFMLLCEFDPDEVYRWFMEMFIDSYDWVMVPNVYGMSQFADGGIMSTKPYISGSNYILKMSDFKKGDWQNIWDGLFWRFMHVHKDFFLQNPRLGMLIRSFDKMPSSKQQTHLKNAEMFLGKM